MVTLDRLVDSSKSLDKDDKTSLKGAWSAHVNRISGTVEARVIKFCIRVGYIVSAYGGQITFKRGVVWVTSPILNFLAPMVTLELLKLVIKFATHQFSCFVLFLQIIPFVLCDKLSY